MSRRAVYVALGVVGAQLAAVGVYLGVGEARRDEAPFPHERLDFAAPVLTLERGEQPVPPPPPPADRPVVVHFWATWCGPCQAELPSLIEAAADEGVPLFAVTEEPWAEVERWFGGTVPSVVVRDPTGRADADWSVSGLPDTYRVRDGRIDGRVGGPRDWSTSEARAWLRGEER